MAAEPLKIAAPGEKIPLHAAAQEDKAPEVEALLRGRADPEACEKSFGWGALHVACGNGAYRSAETLLLHGARVDAEAHDGERPMHLAAAEGHARILGLLAEAGADVNSPNNDGETPLHVAIQHVGSKPSLAHLRELLAVRADLSAKDCNGHTPADAAGIYTNRAEELRKVLAGAPAPAPDPDDPWPQSPGELAGKEPIEAAEALREAGNARFKAGKHEEALKFYLRAKVFLPTGTAAYDPIQDGDAVGARARACAVAVSSNAAACELKLGKHDDCARRCDQVLSWEPENVKAFFRKALALRALGDDADPEDGSPEELLRQALALAPLDAGIKRELADLERERSRQDAKEKRLAKKMFG